MQAHGVRCIVIGGWAAIVHGAARSTNDVDLVYSRDPLNYSTAGSGHPSREPRTAHPAQEWRRDESLRGLHNDVLRFQAPTAFSRKLRPTILEATVGPRIAPCGSGEVTERPIVRHWKCRVGLKPHRGFESPPLRFVLVRQIVAYRQESHKRYPLLELWPARATPCHTRNLHAAPDFAPLVRRFLRR
jgi:hypothetical protein